MSREASANNGEDHLGQLKVHTEYINTRATPESKEEGACEDQHIMSEDTNTKDIVVERSVDDGLVKNTLDKFFVAENIPERKDETDSDVEAIIDKDPLEESPHDDESSEDEEVGDPSSDQYSQNVEKDKLDKSLERLESLVNKLEELNDCLASTVMSEDSFEQFGKYIASLLRGLPAKEANTMKLNFVSAVLKAQMELEQPRTGLINSEQNKSIPSPTLLQNNYNTTQSVNSYLVCKNPNLMAKGNLTSITPIETLPTTLANVQNFIDPINDNNNQPPTSSSMIPISNMITKVKLREASPSNIPNIQNYIPSVNVTNNQTPAIPSQDCTPQVPKRYCVCKHSLSESIEIISPSNRHKTLGVSSLDASASRTLKKKTLVPTNEDSFRNIGTSKLEIATSASSTLLCPGVPTNAPNASTSIEGTNCCIKTVTRPLIKDNLRTYSTSKKRKSEFVGSPSSPLNAYNSKKRAPNVEPISIKEANVIHHLPSTSNVVASASIDLPMKSLEEKHLRDGTTHDDPIGLFEGHLNEPETWHMDTELDSVDEHKETEEAVHFLSEVNFDSSKNFVLEELDIKEENPFETILCDDDLEVKREPSDEAEFDSLCDEAGELAEQSPVENVFHCHMCSEVFQDHSALVTHITKHSKNDSGTLEAAYEEADREKDASTKCDKLRTSGDENDIQQPSCSYKTMGKTYVRKTSMASYSKQNLIKAIEAIKKDHRKVREDGRSYNIPESTLRKQLIQNSPHTRLGRKSIFSPDIEEDFKNYIVNLCNLFYGVTEKQLQGLAFWYAEELKVPNCFNRNLGMAGKNWVHGFLERHPSVRLRQARDTNLKNVEGSNKVDVLLFYSNLNTLLQTHRFKEHRIYCQDEIGFKINKISVQKIFVPKRVKQKGTTTFPNKEKSITGIFSMSAFGHFIPPLIIFSHDYVRMVSLFEKKDPNGTVYVSSKNGSSNANIFLQWLSHFRNHVNPSKSDPVLLILDNHGSHISIESFEFCRQNFIYIVSIPQHTSHKLQPLELTFFGPLKSTFYRDLDFNLKFEKTSTENDASEVLNKAFIKVANRRTAISGFRAAGICPFDPDRLSDYDFTVSIEIGDQQASEEEFSVPQSPIPADAYLK